ncbi:MAG: 1-acyl-sn-glycerol-3-phosphate acyltransferase [Acidobacteria bacterium]|nr:1-acyl-sn-glycerol-3-phosphate acyltransferase [Acidobacteriota bacterium]
MIRTAFVVLAACAYLLFVFTPKFFVSLITRKTDALYRAGVRGCRMAVWLAGIRVEVCGREKIPKDRAVIFMPNHQSMCDPPAMMASLPPVFVLLKRSLFRIPVLGPAMRMHGFVPIDREHRERAMQAVEEAAAKLRSGHSFLVYPEGTRTRDGRLLPFKKGAFVMAMRAQAPIVPVSVSGAYKIMRKGGMALHPGTVRITFHEPVSTEGYAADDRRVVMEKVRAAIITGLAEDEKPASAA